MAKRARQPQSAEPAADNIEDVSQSDAPSMPAEEVKPMSRIVPVSEEDLKAAQASRGNSARTGQMAEYDALIKEGLEIGGPFKVAIDGEKSVRALALRVAYAAERAGMGAYSTPVSDGLIVTLGEPKPKRAPKPKAEAQEQAA